MWTGDDIGDDFGIGRVGNRRLKNADDGGRSLTEANLFADHGGIAFKYRSPEAMGEHGGAGGVRSVIMRVQQPANYWMQAHDLEIWPSTTPAFTSRGSPRPSMVKPMVEKSPKELIDFTPALRSVISGTEKAAF